MAATRAVTRPSGVRIWLMAARVRTLPAAVAPVLVGTALAGYLHVFHPLRFLAALIGAMFIQIGTNLSNDYSDARRGADTDDRLGPVRVTAGGLVPPRQVLIWTYATFGAAVLVGVYLVVVAGWELLAVGGASILAGVLYTGGPRPYGYEGLGEVFVFLFFGIVAVTGSYYVQVEHLRWAAFGLAVPVGLIASAILVVHTVRGLETDRRAGTRTPAARRGRDGRRGAAGLPRRLRAAAGAGRRRHGALGPRGPARGKARRRAAHRPAARGRARQRQRGRDRPRGRRPGGLSLPEGQGRAG